MRVIGKTLLWGLAVLALIGVGLPGAIGFYMARQFDYAVANLIVPGTLEVADSHFERGWFSSQAVITLRPVGALCHASPCPLITLNSTIHHGPLALGADETQTLQPVLAVADTHADLTSLWPRYVFAPVPAPVVLHTRVGLNTQGHVQLHLDGVSFDVARQAPVAHVDSAALDGELNTTLAGRAISNVSIAWPSFDLSPQAGGRLAWRGLNVKSHRSRLAGPMAHTQLHLDSLTLDDGQGRATRISDFDIRLQRAAADTGALNIRARHIVLPDDTQGELHLKMTGEGIVPGAWASLPSQWRALGGRRGGAADDPRLYRDVLPGLLRPGFRFQLKQAALYTEQGPIQLSGHLAVPKALQPALTASRLLQQLDVALTLQMPKALARRFVGRQLAAERDSDVLVSPQAVDRRLANWRQQGLLRWDPDEQAYRAVLRISDGQLRLNDQPQPGWQSVVDQVQATLQGL